MDFAMNCWVDGISYPLVNIQKAIGNGHRNSEFSDSEWWIFPSFFVKLPEDNYHKPYLSYAFFNQ